MPVLIETVINDLKSKSRSDQLEGMARFGMNTDKRLGIAIPVLRKMAKEIGKDHELGRGLWQAGLDEGRILAAMVSEPGKLTGAQMDDWVKDFNSWDVCDQVCMNLFDKSPLAWRKVREWAAREEEFVRRAAFALIACLAWHDKQAADERFIAFLPVIKEASTDNRNFVKKAVNWALRHIGKRNKALNPLAIKTAKEIQKLDSKSARWIAADAIRELESEAVRKRLKN
ncbi:DNA alkylation repair protein [Candidatus Margulisiibacteriota bacterium]